MHARRLSRRRLLATLGAASAGGIAGCGGDGSSSEPTDTETLEGPDEFVDVEGSTFTLGEGTFYVSGAELPPPYAYGLTHPNSEEIRPIIFDHLERIGATVARIHAFDYATVEQGTPFPGEDNETFFKRMDRAIVEAKRRDIRLSVPMVNGAPHYDLDPTENFGMHVPAFVHRVDSAEDIDDFYENEDCIELYRQWVTELLTRENHVTGVEYRNDPTIMLWELGNEVEWENGWERDAGPSIRPWIEQVAPHVQDVMDGNQLVTTGEHGWPDGRNDFLDDHRPDAIDVCSMHWWAGPATYDLGEEDARAQFDDLVETAHDELEKPLWIGEYNIGPAEMDAEAAMDQAFLERRNAQIAAWHDWMDETDVAGTALHILDSKRIHEDIFEHDRRPGPFEVYGDADTGTVTELRRYAERTREKSTASEVPPLQPLSA